MNNLFRALCVLLSILTLPLPGDAHSSCQKRTHVFYDVFDTVITLIGYAENNETFTSVSQVVESQFIQYHQLFDAYHAYDGITNVYSLNEKAKDSPVPVEKPLFDLLLFAKTHQKRFNNTVNIAMGSVLSLWHEAREDNLLNPAASYIPDMKKLQEASAHTNIDNLVLDIKNRTVYYSDPELKLNLGAVAKGYAAQLVGDWLSHSEMPSFIINAGGNIVTGNAPLDGRKHWSVAVQDPDDLSRTKEMLLVHNLSVVTSGDYQRFFSYQGKRYHHLISPSTLMPTDYMRSVTIVTKDSGMADLLSTALFLMPYEQGREFAESLDDVAVLWIMNDGQIRMTNKMKPYVKTYGSTNE